MVATTISEQSISQISAPNPNLNSEQQSEITNAATEVASGHASLSCLQNLNIDPASATTNVSSCLGPGYGIAPPDGPLRVENINGHNAEVERNGKIYSIWITSGGVSPGNNAADFLNIQDYTGFGYFGYSDGWIGAGAAVNASQCNTTYDFDNPYFNNFHIGGSLGAYGPGTATVIPNAVLCAHAQPSGNWGYGNNPSSSAPFGYAQSW